MPRPKKAVKGTVLSSSFLASAMMPDDMAGAYATDMVPGTGKEELGEKYLFVTQQLENLDVLFDGFLWDSVNEKHTTAFNTPLDVLTQDPNEVADIFSKIFDQYPEEFPKISFTTEQELMDFAKENGANLRVFITDQWFTEGSDNTLVPVEVINGSEQGTDNNALIDTNKIPEQKTIAGGQPFDPQNTPPMADPSSIQKVMNPNINQSKVVKIQSSLKDGYYVARNGVIKVYGSGTKKFYVDEGGQRSIVRNGYVDMDDEEIKRLPYFIDFEEALEINKVNSSVKIQSKVFNREVVCFINSAEMESGTIYITLPDKSGRNVSFMYMSRDKSFRLLGGMPAWN